RKQHNTKSKPSTIADTVSWTSKHTKTFKQADLWITNLSVFKSNPTSNEKQFQDRVVQLISIERRPEDALELLSKHYRVDTPTLRIALPAGEKNTLGCDVHRDTTSCISSHEYLSDTYV